MLRDRYDAMNLFELVPALSLAMEPVLAHLDTLLEEAGLFQKVKADLAKRFPRTLVDGRPSTPVEVILRLLVVQHLYGWSYQQTEHWVKDSLVLRQFCRVYLEAVPDDTTLLRWANLIQPQTVHELLDHVVQMARSLKVTRGRKLRTDETVVATNIHHPTDSTLLGDGVRVLSRLLKQAQHLLHRGVAVSHEALAQAAFRDRTRSAHRQVQRIAEATRRKGEQAEALAHRAYARLIEIAQATLGQAHQVCQGLEEASHRSVRRLTHTLATFGERMQHVLTQTEQRVLRGQPVPADQKLVSLFEPHTAIIRKGKAAPPTQFGRMVWLDELEGGVISRYAVLEGNPPEAAQIVPSLDHHRHLFGNPPSVLAGDRGTYSPEGEAYAQTQGVAQVVLPQPGAKSVPRRAHEHQPWFRRGRRWRAGIEGRIHVLKRDYHLDRCLYHGEAGMERWVGWGLLAHDLRMIALATAQ